MHRCTHTQEIPQKQALWCLLYWCHCPGEGRCWKAQGSTQFKAHSSNSSLLLINFYRFKNCGYWLGWKSHRSRCINKTCQAVMFSALSHDRATLNTFSPSFEGFFLQWHPGAKQHGKGLLENENLLFNRIQNPKALAVSRTERLSWSFSNHVSSLLWKILRRNWRHNKLKKKITFWNVYLFS